MIDCHYDLLTYILMKKDEPQFLKQYCKKVYNKENITGGIFNLFYMTEKEMKEELGIKKQDINVIENLKEVKQYIEKNALIPPNIKYIFGIEGLDYLEKIDDIDILYSLGLRSTNIVWSNQNKFGTGVRGSKEAGLTELGEKLVKKLVQKRIAIDLSHANEKTFWDIIAICRNLKKEGKNPIVFASHSNSKTLCNVPRNLTDEQILAIKEFDGIVGLVSYKQFCVDTDDVCNPNIDFEQNYLNHFIYVKKLLGGVDNIAVATDDMRYYFIQPEFYQNANIYQHYNVKTPLKSALIRYNFTETEIKKIFEENFKKYFLNIN